MDYLEVAQTILAPLAVAAIVGYIKLINRSVKNDIALAVNSLKSEVEAVAKDVRKSNERTEAHMDKMERRWEDTASRVGQVEIAQAERLGRDAAIAEMKQH